MNFLPSDKSLERTVEQLKEEKDALLVALRLVSSKPPASSCLLDGFEGRSRELITQGQERVFTTSAASLLTTTGSADGAKNSATHGCGYRTFYIG